MIDPFDTKDNIEKRIIKIKKEVIETVKEQIKLLRDQKKIVLYPRNMNDYIGWLQKYSFIIDYLMKNHSDYLTPKKGAYKLKTEHENFSFQQLVSNGTSGDLLELETKNYKTAYEKSVKLIQQTPDILFSPAR